MRRRHHEIRDAVIIQIAGCRHHGPEAIPAPHPENFDHIRIAQIKDPALAGLAEADIYDAGRRSGQIRTRAGGADDKVCQAVTVEVPLVGNR